MSEEPRIVHPGVANATPAAAACHNAFIRETLRGTQSILAGFSGGPDSTALMLGLVAAWRNTEGPRPRILALHVDHIVRPESAADASACARVAASLSLPFRCLRADPARIFVGGRPSEGRMRAERYRLFRQAAVDTGSSALFLAHHRDDQIETILLSALRGGGLRGLGGMPRQRTLTLSADHPGGILGGTLRVVRPFLGLPQEEVRSAVLAAGLPYLNDPTNDDLRYRRNAIRHALLPRLREELGPRLDDQLTRLSDHARILWRRARLRAAKDDLRTSDDQHAALSALAEEMADGKAAGKIGQRASRILQDAIGSTRPVRVSVHAGLDVIAADGRFTAAPVTRVDLAAPVVTISEHCGHGPRLLRALQALPADERRRRVEQRGRLYLDLDAIRRPLCVRRREPGDRIQILGSSVEKRLKTLLISRAVPRSIRDQLVVFADQDRLVGFEGGPPSAAAALCAATRRTLRIVVRRPSPDG